MGTYKHTYLFALATIYFANCYGVPRLRRSSGMVTVNELSIKSTVSLRYANVLVRSLVRNLDSKDQEISFQVRIPREAYITSFVIVTNEKTIHAYITEKTIAAKEYEKAKENNATAGIVTQQTDIRDDIERDIFQVKVNIAADNTLEFRLQYEELLLRNAGKYSQTIFVDSDHVIPNLEVVCEFKEKQNFKQLTYQTPLDEEKLTINEELITKDGYYKRKILWRPSETEQEGATHGLEKPFEIEYELEPSEDGGIVFINDNGQFAHMFSATCEDTKIMMKQIVFVIDISGSMIGNPVLEVRRTMTTILNKLRSHDYFNIIIFNEKSYMWQGDFHQATQANIADAKLYIESRVNALGSTNINDALLKAVQLFDSNNVPEDSNQFGQMVVFLTDGDPTVGETNTDNIRRNVREVNYYEGEKCCKSSIFTIAFGENAGIEFLSVLASEHEGTITIIRESSNENGEMLQLYRGIENPYFKDLEFNFRIGDEFIPKENVTHTQFRQYDCGNELVVGGWTYPNVEIYPIITAKGLDDGVIFDTVPTVRAENVDAERLSRLVMYKMVKQLLKEALVTRGTDEARSKEASDKAVKLSLRYGFVTPLTSLVVTDVAPKTQEIPTGQNLKGLGMSRSAGGNILPDLQSIYDIQSDIDDSLWVDYDESFKEQDAEVNGAIFPIYTKAVLFCFMTTVFLAYFI